MGEACSEIQLVARKAFSHPLRLGHGPPEQLQFAVIDVPKEVPLTRRHEIAIIDRTESFRRTIFSVHEPLSLTTERATAPARRSVQRALPDGVRLPSFQSSPETIDHQAEIKACTTAQPDSFIRLIGYDRQQQTRTVSLVVHQP